MFVLASLYKRREENQLDAAEWFIALVICSTCFGHLYAHYQELETIIVLLPLMACSEGNNGSEREAGHHGHHREEKTAMVWPRQKDARGENTKINYGLDTTGEK